MSEWKEYKLGEISDDVSYGYTASADAKQVGPKFLRITDIRNDFIDWDSVPYCKIGTRDYAKNKLEHGDIVIARTGATTGISEIIKHDVDAVFASYLIRFRINKQVANPFYVSYILKSKLWENYVSGIISGSAQPGANAKQFSDFSLKVPSIETQNVIAEILSSLDDKIELNNQINANLEALARAIFKHWFIDFEFPDENGNPYKSSGGKMIESELGEIPEAWNIGCLDSVVEFSNGYAFKSMELLDKDIGNCFHVFKMGHIKKGGGFNSESTKSFYERGKATKIQKYILKTGDLLMCMTDMKGNVALLGHTALMNESAKYIVNQRVGLLRANNALCIDYPYLYILTNSTDFIQELRSRANSGVQVNLSTSEIKSTKIIIPEKQINMAFDQLSKTFFEKIFFLTRENNSLIKLRNLLLPKLISGQISIE